MKSLVLIAFCAFFSLQQAHACSCSAWGNATTMLSAYNAAFVVTPLSNSLPTGIIEDGQPMQRTLMSQLMHFKGPVQAKINILSAHDDGANCGANFRKNSDKFLVFAYYHLGRYYTDFCSVRRVNPTDRAMNTFLHQLEAASHH